MDRVDDRTPERRPDGGMTGEPALRDAAGILARVTEDETAARQARVRFRTEPMPALEPDRRIAPMLGPGERVVAVRMGAVFDRRQAGPGEVVPHGLAGSLFVTSRRLVLVGRVTLAFDLAAVDEIGLSGERVLLVMRDGSSLSVDVAQPRLLRVEIGAARASVASALTRAEGADQPGSR